MVFKFEKHDELEVFEVPSSSFPVPVPSSSFYLENLAVRDTVVFNFEKRDEL